MPQNDGTVALLGLLGAAQTSHAIDLAALDRLIQQTLCSSDAGAFQPELLMTSLGVALLAASLLGCGIRWRQRVALATLPRTVVKNWLRLGWPAKGWLSSSGRPEAVSRMFQESGFRRIVSDPPPPSRPRPQARSSGNNCSPCRLISAR